ncbi:MAG TPA: sigma-70 family RNA polymerase sigma factor [Planctomycetota bacterium]|nr:sigma-70 family RNA polymerase sigma factor [Planctomycetota bacterium]
MTASDRRFPTTIWEDISSARKGSSRDLESLLARYRMPIVGFLRWKNIRAEEAEDLAQEVLIRLSQPGFLEKVDPTKGKFRSLLLAVTRNVLSERLRHDQAARRGGGAQVVHESDLADGATPLLERVAASEDSMFDQLWVSELVSRALRELEEAEAARGASGAAAFRLKYLEDLTQEEVAARLGCTVSNAKNYIHSGKLKFKQRLLASIKAYCSTPEEFELEVRRLAPYWKGQDP